MPNKVGFYSQQAVNSGCGTNIYLTTDGQEVEVTAVYETIENAETDYGWPDKKFVGEVTQWVRQKKMSDQCRWELRDQ